MLLLSTRVLKGTSVNRRGHFVNEGPFEIMVTVPIDIFVRIFIKLDNSKRHVQNNIGYQQ